MVQQLRDQFNLFKTYLWEKITHDTTEISYKHLQPSNKQLYVKLSTVYVLNQMLLMNAIQRLIMMWVVCVNRCKDVRGGYILLEKKNQVDVKTQCQLNDSNVFHVKRSWQRHLEDARFNNILTFAVISIHCRAAVDIRRSPDIEFWYLHSSSTFGVR